MTGNNYAAAESALCLPGESLTRIQRCALRACIRAWPNCRYVDDVDCLGRELRITARHNMREEVQREYGFVIATFILRTIAGGALSFLVERILERLFPPKTGYERDHDFASRLNQWSREA